MKNVIQQKQTDTTVDILKFVFCVFVIALHTEILNVFSTETKYYVTNILFRIPVPYFFVASGYYFKKKYSDSSIKQYKIVLFSFIKRLLFPYVVFLLIALRQSWTTNMLNGKSQQTIFKCLIKDTFFYPQGALWFVYALMCAAVITYPVLKKKNGVNICLALGFSLFLFALVCNNYYFLIESTPLQRIVDNYLHIFVSARNGLFVGVVFLSIGMKCYDISHCITRIQKKNRYIYGVILFGSLYVLEIIILQINRFERIDDQSLYLSQLCFIPCLFLLSVLYPIKIPRKTSLLFRNLSTGMYFLHRPILWWVLFYIKNEVIIFVVVFVLAFFICIISYNVKFTNKYYLLR